ncbi:hypothetical protein [Dactylosporangium sp. NPDC051541]|uniref:hypothetical protein n=1 Tax=Dactylosporangium sp. NPDC051541 TaxID=3363977 RepID=UPI0037901B40
MPDTYETYRLPDLWKSMAAEDPDSGFAHVNTLNRLRVALEQQRDNLRRHRDRLMEAWPPDRSDAAAAFLARINGLLDVMTATAAATSRITTGVDETYAALRDTRRRLDALMTDYRHHPTGAGLTAAPAGRPDLDQQARQAFITTDARIVRASALINSALPQPVMSPADSTESVDADYGIARLGARPSTGSTQSTVLPTPVFSPPAPAGTDADGLGAHLTGIDADSLGAHVTGVDAGPVPTGRPGDSTAPAPRPSFSGLIGGPPGTSLSHPAPARPAPAVLGPGGVIGAPKPPSPSAAPATTSAAAMGGAIQRGGVAKPTARRRAAAAPVAASDPTGARGARGASGDYRDLSYETYRERRRAGRSTAGTDGVWPVQEGVPPVIEAAPEKPHDPGPGVVGIDR